MIALKQEDFKLYGEKDDVRVESDYVLAAECTISKFINFTINANRLNTNILLTRQQLKDLVEVLTELSKLL